MRIPNPWIAVTISIIALLVSVVSTYYNIIYESENLGVLVLEINRDVIDLDPPSPGGTGTTKLVGLIPDMAFVNSGNRDVLVLDIRMKFQLIGEIASRESTNPSDNSILIPPRTIRQIRKQFSLPHYKEEKDFILPVSLVIVTIGPSGELKETEVNIGELRYVGGNPESIATLNPKVINIR